MKIQQETHDNELEAEKKKLKETIEETKASTCTVESIKTKALVLSEELTTRKNEILDMINSIGVEREEQLKIQITLV